MNIYLIVLEGQGDVTITPVDQETWDWLFKVPPDFKNKSSMKDPDVPASQQAKGNNHVSITRGSWENDRALAALPADGYTTYYTVRSAMTALKNNNDTLVDEYQGCIY